MGRIDQFDGIEQQTAAIDGNRYDTVGKHFTANVNLWPRPVVIFTSRHTFAALTPSERELLRRRLHSLESL